VFDYSFDKPIKLSLGKKPPLTKELYKRDVASFKPAKPKKDAKFSVIIVAYNENESIFELLDSLRSQTEQNFEIVIVDNGLDKAVRNKLSSEASINYITTSSNLGPSWGRNIGASYAKGGYLLFLDADGGINNSLLSSLDDFVSEHPEAVALRGKVISKNQGSSVLTSPIHYDLGDAVVNHYPSTEGISAWERATFLRVGGFEESLYGGEGIVLSYRAYEFYGIPWDSFYYVPSLILYHDYNSSESHLVKKVKRTEIARKKITLHYPLMKEYISLYTPYHHLGSRKRSSQDLKKVSLLNNTKRQTDKMFNEHLDKIFESRWNNGLLDVSNPDFTVVIPHYNLGEMAHEAVKSVMRQSLPDIEIIVVDDLSTDKHSLEQLRILEDKVKVVYQKHNTGVSGARNTGIKLARAKYILCLDSDDTIEPEYLEQAYNTFEAFEDVGVVSTWVNIFGGRNGLWKPAQNVGLPEALIDSPIPNASCFRKKTWSDAGGYYEGIRGYEDWHFWVSILSKSWKIKVLPYPHYNYYVRPGSKVNTSNKNAVALVSAIVRNNRKLYEDNLEYVIGTKHRQIVELRQRVRQLEERPGLLTFVRSVPGRLMLATRMTATGLKEALALMARGDLIGSGLLVKRKLRSALKLVRTRIKAILR
jgi:glycosyltransferase involved in cell wall biosynthesis